MKERKVIIKTGLNLENSYASLPETFFTRQSPSCVPSPKLAVLNYPLITSLGLNAQVLQSADGVGMLAGNKIPEGSIPIAQAYGGHQFGHFTMLGDGRALLIGEHITPLGERVDIQLKGSGKTQYSRGGDGKAALGPMLREYIISEAMNALGIPTTRSLAVVTTGESIMRETKLPGAILTRIAASHIRVGTFEYVSRWGTVEELKVLADYTLKRHFKEGDNKDNRYLFLLQEVIKRQAELIAKWQLVGFVHGVMNTDNMAISGETIDYGPCAFMDVYDPETVFSSIDIYGRYAYGNQPNIATWNIARFAETLLPLLHIDQNEAIRIAENEVSNFTKLYKRNWLSGMRAKLGIFNQEFEDEYLIEELLSIMNKYGADYTNTFCALTFDNIEDTVLFDKIEFDKWHKLWTERLTRQEESKLSSKQLMKNSNPAVIPRNHRVEEALEAAVKEGDYSVMKKLLDVLSKPYDHSKDQDHYSRLPEPSTCPYKTYCGT
ncbi:YdiU family protein [Clostridium sporogenes]|uniref:Protein nucleotidyltransferase YdiU n=1 Tax=Clostridium botulinum TaxID=1491 RepID=A0A6M0SY67_CLOBO|nr:YdiU family protein [Clostridium sporogenes]NFA60449.1 YdiU family protein [Clostridium botulinum]NFI72268.1 YdiU family protein [Clostridium sporogenes]NFL72618.1 YdiU family protein [Clostridium sporogenes]NFM24531.1 YdiU family protein [Clostridium sporogenes]NFP60884.1 YdiU family protein [Clostridium sporogenes]